MWCFPCTPSLKWKSGIWGETNFLVTQSVLGRFHNPLLIWFLLNLLLIRLSHCECVNKLWNSDLGQRSTSLVCVRLKPTLFWITRVVIQTEPGADWIQEVKPLTNQMSPSLLLWTFIGQHHHRRLKGCFHQKSHNCEPCWKCVNLGCNRNDFSWF